MPAIALSLFLKYGLPVLAVAGLLFGAYHWAYERGVDHEVGKYQPKLEKALVAVNAGIKALSITKASLARANGEIEDNNRRIEQANQQLIHDRAQAAQNDAMNAKKAQSTNAIIDGLQKATTAARKPCTQSEQSKEALEHL